MTSINKTISEQLEKGNKAIEENERLKMKIKELERLLNYQMSKEKKKEKV